MVVMTSSQCQVADILIRQFLIVSHNSMLYGADVLLRTSDTVRGKPYSCTVSDAFDIFRSDASDALDILRSEPSDMCDNPEFKRFRSPLLLPQRRLHEPTRPAVGVRITTPIDVNTTMSGV